MIRRILLALAATAALLAPAVVAAGPAEAAVNVNWTNQSFHGYRVGIVTTTGSLGYDYLLAAGSHGTGIGVYNPSGACTRVYYWDGAWLYRFTLTQGGQWFPKLAGSYTVIRIAC
jgi:hypothetical protein